MNLYLIASFWSNLGADISETWKKLLDALNNFISTGGWRIVLFFAVLLAGIIIIRIISRIIRRIFMRGPMDKTLGTFFLSIIKFIMYLVLVFILAGEKILNIDMTPITTAMLSAGLAISLALENSLANLANGILLIVTKPFKVGDTVEIAGISGTIKSIKMISTEIITFDNRKVFVPNSKITSDCIINISARPTRRVDLAFSVAYDNDPDKVKQIIMDALCSHPKRLADPEPMVKLSNCSDKSMDFIARCWVNSDDYWDVYWDLTESVAKGFRAANISIPRGSISVSINKEDDND